MKSDVTIYCSDCNTEFLFIVHTTIILTHNFMGVTNVKRPRNNS